MQNLKLTDVQKEHIWEISQQLWRYTSDYDLVDDIRFMKMYQEIKRHAAIIPKPIFIQFKKYIESQLVPYLLSDRLLDLDTPLEKALDESPTTFSNTDRRFIFLYKHKDMLLQDLPQIAQHQHLIDFIKQNPDQRFVAKSTDNIVGKINELCFETIKRGFLKFYMHDIKPYITFNAKSDNINVYQQHTWEAYAMIERCLAPRTLISNQQFNELRFDLYLHQPLIPDEIYEPIDRFSSNLFRLMRNNPETLPKLIAETQIEFNTLCDDYIFPFLRK